MKKTIIFGVLLVITVVFIFGCTSQVKSDSQVKEKVNEVVEVAEEVKEEVAGTVAALEEIVEQVAEEVNTAVASDTIVFTFADVQPQTLTIRVGDTVTFLSEEGTHWVASDVHPTHTEYPGSTIAKCNKGDEALIFDACRVISKGNSYSFTFTEAGTWGFHDHIHTSLTGTIVVE
jgi:plastocyanin